MSYTFFGNNFGHIPKKTPEEVIVAAKKQKLSEDAINAATNPLKTLVTKTVKVVSGKGQTVSDEQFIRAILLKELRDRGILPKQLHQIIDQKISEKIEKHKIEHPHWKNLYT